MIMRLPLKNVVVCQNLPPGTMPYLPFRFLLPRRIGHMLPARKKDAMVFVLLAELFP
jgi:hypothetical protein